MKLIKLSSGIIMFGMTTLFFSCVSSNPNVVAKGTPSSAIPGAAVEQELSGENVLKRKVAIARFSNETSYAKGAFYDKENDQMGNQAMDILSSKLAASNKFILLERKDLELINEEAELSGIDVQKIGADYLIIGSLTKFGRKNTGEQGVASRTKRQTVEAGVSIRLVDVSTGQIIYAEEADGIAETESKTVVGIGGTAGYDATLTDKAIDAALSQLVENIINNCMDRPWKSYILSYDDIMVIAGGKTQGVHSGDVFDVLLRGKKVKNPQTGMLIELPGTKIGSVTVLSTGGEDPNNEYSICEFSGSLDKTKLDNYIIQETK